MLAPVAIIWLAVTTIAVNGVKFTPSVDAVLQQFNLWFPIWNAQDSQSAVQHYRDLREYVYFMNAIQGGPYDLFSARFKALLATSDVGAIDRYLATFGGQQAELEVFVASEQAEWQKISQHRAGLVLEFTGDSKLAAALNQLTAEQIQVFRTKLLPKYHKDTVVVVQQYRQKVAKKGTKPSDQEQLEVDLRKVYTALRKEHLKVNADTNKKVEVLFAAFPAAPKEQPDE